METSLRNTVILTKMKDLIQAAKSLLICCFIFAFVFALLKTFEWGKTEGYKAYQRAVAVAITSEMGGFNISIDPTKKKLVKVENVARPLLEKHLYVALVEYQACRENLMQINAASGVALERGF